MIGRGVFLFLILMVASAIPSLSSFPSCSVTNIPSGNSIDNPCIVPVYWQQEATISCSQQTATVPALLMNGEFCDRPLSSDTDNCENNRQVYNRGVATAIRRGDILLIESSPQDRLFEDEARNGNFYGSCTSPNGTLYFRVVIASFQPGVSASTNCAFSPTVVTSEVSPCVASFYSNENGTITCPAGVQTLVPNDWNNAANGSVCAERLSAANQCAAPAPWNIAMRGIAITTNGNVYSIRAPQIDDFLMGFISCSGNAGGPSFFVQLVANAGMRQPELPTKDVVYCTTIGKCAPLKELSIGGSIIINCRGLTDKVEPSNLLDGSDPKFCTTSKTPCDSENIMSFTKIGSMLRTPVTDFIAFKYETVLADGDGVYCSCGNAANRTTYVAIRLSKTYPNSATPLSPPFVLLGLTTILSLSAFQLID